MGNDCQITDETNSDTAYNQQIDTTEKNYQSNDLENNIHNEITKDKQDYSEIDIEKEIKIVNPSSTIISDKEDLRNENNITAIEIKTQCVNDEQELKPKEEFDKIDNISETSKIRNESKENMPEPEEITIDHSKETSL